MSNANTSSTDPGERLIRTLTNVEFGHNRPPDEPAPLQVVILYHLWLARHAKSEVAATQYDTSQSRADFASWVQAGDMEGSAWRNITGCMRNHRSSCYVVDGVRLQWYTEPHGSRREYLKIEECKP